LVAFGIDKPPALGNIWRITSKNADFYLDPIGETNAFHLSAHGPNDLHPDGHRFHIKVDRRAAVAVKARGDFFRSSVSRKGFAVDGQELVPGAFRVARIRWVWDLQRPRFRSAAIRPGPLPDLSDSRSAARLSQKLKPNDVADLDIVVSYDEPHWPNGIASLHDNARLGPLRNDAGMCLTATSFRRSETTDPTPPGLRLPLPKPGEEPSRITSGGPDQVGGMYWFVEAITSRQFLEGVATDSGG
jgi:hypothetical protein